MTPHISGTTIDGQVCLLSCLVTHVSFIHSKSLPNVNSYIWNYITTMQLRYAAGVKDMLDCYFKGQEFPAQNYIVKEGKLASQYL